MANFPNDSNGDPQARYVVGIDLGTSNSAVAFIDSAGGENVSKAVQCLEIEQHTAPGEISRLETLPSFHFEPPTGSKVGKLSWEKSETEEDYVVGAFARDFGGSQAGRTVSSAKSWLCHAGVDRTADLLPWHGAEDVTRLSPVEASSRYLSHLRHAWDAAHPTEPLADQDVQLTLPASFDEVARELTVEAAKRAGLPRIVLIEEPQAAFYAWIAKHPDWADRVQPGENILVCDVGGGTTDFTLIRVRAAKTGEVQFHRVAVGDHLILGGDNLDLSLAGYLEQKFTSGKEKLPAHDWDTLIRSARRIKEQLLGENPPAEATVTLAARGSKLLGSTRQVKITRAEVEETLLEGFFPTIALNDKPLEGVSGFREFGLPYAADPAVTKYLANFLTSHRDVVAALEDHPDGVDPVRPDKVLFNGGAFASPKIQARIVANLAAWFAGGSDWQPEILENESLHLAVARGAAYYGLVRRGIGTRITAQLARSYYVGFESKDASNPQAICVLPGNAEVDDVHSPEQTFQLTTGQPVEFPLYYSSVRLADAVGQVVTFDAESMRSLPPIRTVLKAKKKKETQVVPVRLQGRLTEIGTLDLACKQADGDREWKLQFDVRSAVQTDKDVHQSAAEAEGILDEQTWQEVAGVLADVFVRGEEKPSQLVNRLEDVLEQNRDAWPTSLLRRIWEELQTLRSGRENSAAHQTRWLNLVGFCLRPGYGLAMDDWRVDQTYRGVQSGLKFASPETRSQLWILWRRMAGGLSAGQQQALAQPLISAIRALHVRTMTGKQKGESPFQLAESAEAWRLLGGLELLEVSSKRELGRMICDLLPKRKAESVRDAMLWALGRMGARQPVYGPLNCLVSPETAAEWLEAISRIDVSTSAATLAVMQLARKVDDRYRDIKDAARVAAVDFLNGASAKEELIKIVREGGELSSEQQQSVFGESLPVGLRIE